MLSAAWRSCALPDLHATWLDGAVPTAPALLGGQCLEALRKVLLERANQLVSPQCIEAAEREEEPEMSVEGGCDGLADAWRIPQHGRCAGSGVVAGHL